MAFYKTNLPRLLSKKELQAKSLEHHNNLTPSVEKQEAEAVAPQIPEGLLFYFKSEEEHSPLAIAAFELSQMLLNLLEKIEGLSSDGKSALPFQLYPQFEQGEGTIGFRLIGDELLIEKAFRLIKKMQGHLNALKEQKAKLQQIPPSWALVYRQFFNRLRQYRQSIQLVDSSNDLLLCSITSDDCERLILGLDNLKAIPQKVSLFGKITGFSQNKQMIDFQINVKDWNGIRMKKSVLSPISCKANHEMIRFAKEHMDKLVELEAFLHWDETANKHYQLQAIVVKTASGVEKKRIVYKGPRGGEFYLSYKGKRVYLRKAKRS